MSRNNWIGTVGFVVLYLLCSILTVWLLWGRTSEAKSEAVEAWNLGVDATAAAEAAQATVNGNSTKIVALDARVSRLEESTKRECNERSALDGRIAAPTVPATTALAVSVAALVREFRENIGREYVIKETPEKQPKKPAPTVLVINNFLVAALAKEETPKFRRLIGTTIAVPVPFKHGVHVDLATGHRYNLTESGWKTDE